MRPDEKINPNFLAHAKKALSACQQINDKAKTLAPDSRKNSTPEKIQQNLEQLKILVDTALRELDAAIKSATHTVDGSNYVDFNCINSVKALKDSVSHTIGSLEALCKNPLGISKAHAVPKDTDIYQLQTAKLLLGKSVVCRKQHQSMVEKMPQSVVDVSNYLHSGDTTIDTLVNVDRSFSALQRSITASAAARYLANQLDAGVINSDEVEAVKREMNQQLDSASRNYKKAISLYGESSNGKIDEAFNRNIAVAHHVLEGARRDVSTHLDRPQSQQRKPIPAPTLKEGLEEGDINGQARAALSREMNLLEKSTIFGPRPISRQDYDNKNNPSDYFYGLSVADREQVSADADQLAAKNQPLVDAISAMASSLETRAKELEADLTLLEGKLAKAKTRVSNPITKAEATSLADLCQIKENTSGMIETLRNYAGKLKQPNFNNDGERLHYHKNLHKKVSDLQKSTLHSQLKNQSLRRRNDPENKKTQWFQLPPKTSRVVTACEAKVRSALRSTNSERRHKNDRRVDTKTRKTNLRKPLARHKTNIYPSHP